MGNISAYFIWGSCKGSIGAFSLQGCGFEGLVLDVVWLTLDITVVSMCTTYWKGTAAEWCPQSVRIFTLLAQFSLSHTHIHTQTHTHTHTAIVLGSELTVWYEIGAVLCLAWRSKWLLWRCTGNSRCTGCVMASRDWPLVSPCEICGERCGIMRGFSPWTAVLLCQYHSTHSSYSLCCQKDERSKPGDIQTL